MALHAASDPQVSALRSLLADGLNAELQPTTTEKVVHATYGWPAATQGQGSLIPQMALPALCVYRASDREFKRTMQRPVETESVFRFDYVVSATPLQIIDNRWPLLRLVWDQLLELVCAGKHSAVSGGAEVLDNAGFTEILFDGQSPQVQYGAPAVSDGIYPTFRGQIKLTHRETVDLSALPDVSLHVQVWPDELPEDERPQAEQILRQPWRTIDGETWTLLESSEESWEKL